MDAQVEYSTVCYSVRSFSSPRTANIVIGVLAAFVVLVNVLAMVSVLKNYRRLRQRIYVFVISLAAADILAGIIFLADVIYDSVHYKSDSSNGDVAIFHAEIDGRQKYVGIEAVDNGLSQEILETFKVGVIVLSVLSIALMTFALYKRTTSMGRHHEDFKNMNTAMGADSNSFLPAFDTMMRVLSIGTPGVVNGMGKNAGRGSEMSQTSNDSPSGRRTSVASKMSRISHRAGSSFSKETADAILLEKLQEGHGSATRRTQVIKLPTENRESRKSNPKRKASVGRIINNTGRRVSNAFRGRTASGGQSYVGRHSYSVMSKGATRSSLLVVWLVFVVTCTLPPILRRSGSDSVVCPAKCHSVELFELSLELDSGSADNDKNSQTSTELDSFLNSANPRSNATASNSRGQVNVTSNEGGSITRSEHPVVQNPNGIVSDWSTKSVESNSDSRKRAKKMGDIPIGGACARERDFRPYDTPSLLKVSEDETLEWTPVGSDSPRVTAQNSLHSSCSSCSPAFFPMSKSHMIFVALVVVLTWCWLIISASRLLYLRKHSTNVFVRCSALWRFMFMTGMFYLVTLTPYVAWIILDFTTTASASKSPLWYSEPDDQVNTPNASDTYSNHTVFSVQFHDSSYFHPFYGITASCLLMVNLLVLPSLYLIRLLGFRRIISAL